MNYSGLARNLHRDSCPNKNQNVTDDCHKAQIEKVRAIYETSLPEIAKLTEK
jgi:hypothetical protein